MKRCLRTTIIEGIKINLNKLIAIPCVIKRHFVKHRGRFFIQYNHFQGNRFIQKRDSKKFKNRLFGCSKRLVNHTKNRKLKDLNGKQRINGLVLNNKAKNIIDLPNEHVGNQIKAQLTLLKSGKRTDPSEKKTQVRNSSSLSGESFSEFSFKIGSSNNEDDESTEKLQQNDINDNINKIVKKCINLDEDLKNQNVLNGNDNSRNIVDVLMSKVNKLSSIDHTEPLSSVQVNNLCSEDHAELSPTIQHLDSTDENSEMYKNISFNMGKILLCNENSRSSDEFFGFTEAEIKSRKTNNNVNKNHAAFISEVLDKYLIENELSKDTEVVEARKRFSDSLVTNFSQPPKLSVPMLPEELKRSRTVAEKRTILQKFKNPNLSIIDDIQTISHELKKRKGMKKFNMNIVKHLRNSYTPMPRDSWKATSWLLTEQGRYYYQVCQVDGTMVKLSGSYGNHKELYLPSIISKPLSKEIVGCSSSCNEINEVTNLRPIKSTISKPVLPASMKLKLSPNHKNNQTKPGPLSKKMLQTDSDDDLIGGPLEIYKMPQIQLEVFPKLNQPLDEHIKRYLKLITPQVITKEWAKFAVSTLIESKMGGYPKNVTPSSFTFPVPYKNDQNRIVVREMIKRDEPFENPTRKEEFTFVKTIDQNDPIATECGNILSEMINSVGYCLSEDSLIGLDPDIMERYCKEPNKKTNDELPKKLKLNNIKPVEITQKSKKKNRLLTELKRLNATIIDAETRQDELNDQCSEDHCRLGCICKPANQIDNRLSLQHCGQSKCMLGCQCTFPTYNKLFSDKAITAEEAINFRRQATAKLAPLEKEFTSTVLITNNETLLINEKQIDRKRRCTKLPKRYNDFLDSETVDALNPTSIKRSKTSPASSPSKTEPFLTIKSKPPVVVNEKTLKLMKHCQVTLPKLTHLNNVSPWCMVHCVYQCPCSCQDIEGKPIIEIDEPIETTEVPLIRKAFYSFEKDEANLPMDCALYHADENSINGLPLKNFNMDVDIMKHYINCGMALCKRVVPIPIGPFRRKNQKRVAFEKKKVLRNEDEKSNSLLQHRIDTCKGKKTISFSRSESEINDEISNQPLEKRLCKNITNMKNVFSTNDLTVADSSNNNKGSSQCLQKEQKPTNVKENSVMNNKLVEDSSLNKKDTNTRPLLNIHKPILHRDTSSLEFMPQTNNLSQQINGKLISEKSLERLNKLVKKKINDIITLQKKIHSNLSMPVRDTICIFPWNNFVNSYHRSDLFVWEVKTISKKMFAVTLKNTMPLIENALSVINIRAINQDDLPKLFQFVSSKKIIEDDVTISVIMHGFDKFWHILGIIEGPTSPVSPEIFTPTPQTHPMLAEKINTLYNVLVEQETQFQKKVISNLGKGINKFGARNLFGPENPGSSSILNQSNEGLTIEDVLIHCYDDIKTNIQLRDIRKEDLMGHRLPTPEKHDHRWLVLDLIPDFSHMYLASTKEFISLERIKKTLLLAGKENKIVRLQIGNESTPYGCYVTPTSNNKIFFGPLGLIQSPPIVVLFQLVEGKMIPREDYESMHNISRDMNTLAFWIVQRNQECALTSETGLAIPNIVNEEKPNKNNISTNCIKSNLAKPLIRTFTPEELNSKVEKLNNSREKKNEELNTKEKDAVPVLAGRRRRRKSSHKILHDSNSDPIFNMELYDDTDETLPPQPPLKVKPPLLKLRPAVSILNPLPESENGLKTITTNTWGVNTIDCGPISSNVNEMSSVFVNSDNEFNMMKTKQRTLEKKGVQKRKNRSTDDLVNRNNAEANMALIPQLPVLKRRPDYNVFKRNHQNHAISRATATVTSTTPTATVTSTTPTATVTSTMPTVTVAIEKEELNAYSLANIDIQPMNRVVDLPVHIINESGIEPITASMLVKPKPSPAIYTSSKETMIYDKIKKSLSSEQCISTPNFIRKITPNNSKNKELVANKIARINENVKLSGNTEPNKSSTMVSLDRLQNRIKSLNTIDINEPLSNSKQMFRIPAPSLQLPRPQAAPLAPSLTPSLTPSVTPSVTPSANPSANPSLAPPPILQKQKPNLVLQINANVQEEAYGYFVPSNNEFPKCLSKQNGNMFAIRIPNGGPGIVRLRGVGSVNRFLKDYVRTHNPDLRHKVDSCNWHFRENPKMYRQLQKFAIKRRIEKIWSEASRHTRAKLDNGAVAKKPNEVILIDDDDS